MSLLKSLWSYTLFNGAVGLVGIALTVLIGKQLGSGGFGELASLVALQNIWAALGFMRIETRFATCSNFIEADKILLTGFLLGGLLSAALGDGIANIPLYLYPALLSPCLMR